MPTAITSIKDILGQVRAPRAITLNCAAVNKGIDNYRADVEISAKFGFMVREIVDKNLKRLLEKHAVVSGNSETMVELRDCYTDLIKVTLHRSKTDLKPEQILILQFGIVKFVIQEVREAIGRYSKQLEETLGQQQYSGSRSLLTTQEKQIWFRKHSPEFSFRLTKLFLRQLQREENNHLKTLREQILGDRLPEAVSILYNPLLYARSPREPLLLLDYYAVWPGNGAEFEKLNIELETALAAMLPELPFEPLKSTDKLSSAQSEVFDELGGLFAAQTLLGPSEDQKDDLTETFSWLDHPGNLRLLFDEKIHERHLSGAKDNLGFTGQWGLKGDIKKLQKSAQDLRRAVGDTKAFKLVMASYALREKLQQTDLGAIDIDAALALVSGVDSRKIAQAVDGTQEGAVALQSKLEECKVEFEKTMKESPDELWLRFLTDYSRYRLHLKYFRFAHRVFNRLSVITEPEKIQLAKAGGNLYRFATNDEIKQVVDDEGPEIIHHAILKADVRGSTTVTTELLRQGLNPASYFSLRFFNPINERLATYGAVKVFIEGDAVILGLYEHEGSPDQWFSVSRACGMAKEMLDIITSKNANSTQTSLPLLEIGIGICFADSKPLFLFDEKRPIMISSAIGDADRMSSCSWKLRAQYEPGNFNVGVMQIADGDSQKGEKGQELIRYNVNGIVLDDAAFEKLKSEVHFKRIRAKSGEGSETFFVGRYPDVLGKERDLIVREGKVGLWRGDTIDLTADTGLVYYEVLPNTKFARQIMELASKNQGGA